MNNLQLGIVGRPESGKSTFVAANVTGRCLVFDSDGRWDSVAPLAGGAEFLMANRAANVKPLVMADELDRIVTEDVSLVIVDSVTKIYSVHARKASMQGRLGRQERQDRGLGAAKYTDMLNKADAMQLLANIPAYGAGVFYIWHRGEALNVGKKVQGAGEYDMVEVDKISQVELDTLKASMSMVLAFTRGADGGYYVTVESARAITNKAPRVGFAIADYADNYWKGGLQRIHDLTYVNFTGQNNAMEWVAGKLGGVADDYIDFYEHVKEQYRPKTSSQMWFYLITETYDEAWRRSMVAEAERQVNDSAMPPKTKNVAEQEEVFKPVTAEPSPQTVYAETPPEETETPLLDEFMPEPPPEEDDIIYPEDLFDRADPEDRPYREVTLESGEVVDEKAWPYYWKYKDAYGEDPKSVSDIRNAGKHEGWW
jgi:hypothetical protein